MIYSLIVLCLWADHRRRGWCMVKVVTIDAIGIGSDMATCPRQTIVLWPNSLPLECGVIRAHDRSLRGGSASGSASGRLSIQVSHRTGLTD